MSSRRALGGGAVLALLVPVAAACGGPAGPPSVTVAIGDQQVALRPTQYCADGELARYAIRPPVIAAPPATRVRLTVPSSVAGNGWSVQVFDDQLKTQIGQVEAGKATTFDRITTSDPAPPGFYLVIAERGGSSACQGLAGAWPVGIIRAGAGSPGGTPATGSASPPAGG